MAKAKKTDSTDLKKVKFLKSPTGKYGLAYSAGDETYISDADVADEMVSSGFAEVVE